MPWLVIAPAGCSCLAVDPSTIPPAGQAAGITAWWGSEPIRLTSKNYVLGVALGAAAGALGMHLWMKKR